MLHYYYCHIYLPNINHHIMSLMCTELQHTQLLLRCDTSFEVENLDTNMRFDISGVIICRDLRYVMKLGMKRCSDMHSAFFICRNWD